VSSGTLTELRDLFARKGIPAAAQLSGVNRVIGGGATDIEVITEQDARRVIDVLVQRPEAVPADVVPDDRPPTTEVTRASANDWPRDENSEYDPTTNPECGTDGAR
jgi:hypothetical protein